MSKLESAAKNCGQLATLTIFATALCCGLMAALFAGPKDEILAFVFAFAFGLIPGVLASVPLRCLAEIGHSVAIQERILTAHIRADEIARDKAAGIYSYEDLKGAASGSEEVRS